MPVKPKKRKTAAKHERRPKNHQSNKTLAELSARHLRFAEELANGTHTRTECLRIAGFSVHSIAGMSGKWIAKTREQSYYPALWDYYHEQRRERLRLWDIDPDRIKQEIAIIAFSDLTKFVSIPTRRDLERAAIYAAEARAGFGYTDAEDEELLASKTAQEIREERDAEAERAARVALGDKAKDISELAPGKPSPEELRQFAPGCTVKLKALEDLPEWIRPAIAEISETRDGIKVKLHSKTQALDMAARINKMYEQNLPGTQPMTINNLNLVVKGSRSQMLSELL